MSDDDFHPGTIQRLDRGFEGRLERRYGQASAAVWAMLTEPRHLAQWLAPGTIELRQGGAVRIDFADSGIVIDSTVTALEPRRVLEYSWSSGQQPERPIRWALAEEAGIPVGFHLAVIVQRERAASTVVARCMGGINTGPQLAEPIVGLIMTGTLDRYPRLKVVMAESGLAWIPHVIQTLDRAYERFAYLLHEQL